MIKRNKNWNRKTQGSIGGPLLMWILGVPGGLVLLIWLFFFRGK